MYLTNYTDYSFRILVYCANRPEELTQIGTIAEYYQISAHHVGKIVTQLGRHGFLEIVRGRNGGFRLTKAALDKTLADVVVTMEPHFNLVECFRAPAENHCAITDQCRLIKPLRDAKAAFLESLRGHRLEEILLTKRNIR